MFSFWNPAPPKAEPLNNNDEISIPSEQDEMLIDETGDTPLHECIKHCQQINDVYEFIKQDLKQATIQSRTINHQGELPYDLVLSMPFLHRDCIKLQKYLLSLMISQRQLIKPSEVLDVSEIYQRYAAHRNRRLDSNLELAVKAVNHTRSIIWESSTHLHTNSFSPSRQSTIKYVVSTIRGASSFNFFADSESDLIVKAVEQYHAGNCYEYAVLTKNYLIQLNHALSLDLVSIQHGDHVFVVIDKNQDCDIADYRNWGPNAVICDAWAGEVYPASDIVDRLKNFRWIEEYRVITNFNPSYHQLKITNVQFNMRPTPY